MPPSTATLVAIVLMVCGPTGRALSGTEMLTRRGGGVAHGADYIVLQTNTFSLSIDRKSCACSIQQLHHPALPSRITNNASTVPFVSLYNRVADAHLTDLGACVSVSEPSPGVLVVEAPHGAGNVSIGVEIDGGAVVFTIVSVAQWLAEPSERHLAFGEFWKSVPELQSTPVVSGKLHGPRPADANVEALAAGFITISTNAFFNVLFSASVGDKTAFVFALDGKISGVLASLGRTYGFASDNTNPNAYTSWYWPPAGFDESSRAEYAEKANRLGVDVVFVSEVLTKELAEDSIRFPSGFNQTARYLRSVGLEVGLHILPIIVWPTTALAQERPEVLVPEGLAPTFRSGRSSSKTHPTAIPSEDLAFWWCHERTGRVAAAGNPTSKFGRGKEWCAGLDMSLHGCYWSTAGKYRSGGAVGFAGNGSYAVVDPSTNLTQLFDPTPQLTLSLVLHPMLPNGTTRAHQVIVSKAGQFELSIVAISATSSGLVSGLHQGNLRWSVLDTAGSWQNATTAGAPIFLDNQAGYTVKCTFNGTSKIFVNGMIGGASTSLQSHGVNTSTTSTSSMAGGSEPLFFGSLDATISSSQLSGFVGAIEEISLKNVSAEDRVGYLFAEPSIRPTGTYLVDLSRPAGRDFFASTVAGVLNNAASATVHIDGFEKLAMIGGQDFAHSLQTFSSPWQRVQFSFGFPAQVHQEGWPARWGQGILEGLEQAHGSLTTPTAMEVSLMVPGAGPWRPEITPYIDEPPESLMTLGMTWHGGMLLRMYQSGTTINAYCTRLSFLLNLTIGDYWWGGLITGGIPPQPCEVYDDGEVFWSEPKLAANVKSWAARSRHYGHSRPGGILPVEPDVFLSSLVGSSGPWPGAVLGLYLGPNAPSRVILPQHAILDNATVLLFVAHGLNFSQVSVAYGRPEFKHFTVTMMGNVDNVSMTLAGPFWQLQEQNVNFTRTDEQGVVLQSGQVFSHAQSGNCSFQLPEMQVSHKLHLVKWSQELFDG
jgi:hypothetical protein